MAKQGRAGHGMARQGRSGQGRARQGNSVESLKKIYVNEQNRLFIPSDSFRFLHSYILIR